MINIDKIKLPLAYSSHHQIVDADGNLAIEVFSGGPGVEAARQLDVLVVAACNSYAQLLADNATLREDLSDARNGWEAAVDDVHEMNRVMGRADELREQMLDAIKAAEAVFTKQKWLDYTTDPESIALAKLRAAIAAAGAA